MSAQAETAPASAPSTWIYGPWTDLIFGCGAWSAPLLLIAALLGTSHFHAWTVAFYLLAIVFNYPHFMATIYRAYRTKEEFVKYRVFTLHLTALLVLTGLLAHAWFPLVPWVFTLYICWSPWHYSRQNFGLLMMFLRRNGATVNAAERRLLHYTFVASYIMLLISFQTGASGDPLVLSLGFPAKLAHPAEIVTAGAFLVLSAVAFLRLAKSGLRALAAPLTLLLSQFLWFLVPILLSLAMRIQIPQSRYSSGILAVLHSAQYLWITSYYAQREARAAGRGWSRAAYFGTLLAGGIALFIPGPWIVSYIFHYDFAVSFLIFTALVNIHHFILDGAIWKLRDSRIATLLTARGGRAAEATARQSASAAATGGGIGGAWQWLTGSASSARAFRITTAALLITWGAVDQVHYFLGWDDGNLAHLVRAASLNPYDSSVQMKIARVESQEGNLPQAEQALTRAVSVNPANPGPQEARARVLIEERRYPEALEEYRQLLAISPRDPDALVNYGLLMIQKGDASEAVNAWQKAVAIDPEQTNAQVYLAQALDHEGNAAAAGEHYERFLELIAADQNREQMPPAEIVSAMLALADDNARLNRTPQAIQAYRSAATLAEKAGDSKLESLAWAHLAELQEANSDATAAAGSYQRSLLLDQKSGDTTAEAADWFNYGQFLRRSKESAELAFACVLRAEDLLRSTGGEQYQTVSKVRQQLEQQIGSRSATVRKKLSAYLLQASSFGSTKN
ncbi:MAG: tetratricopeptide repeat protein [Candidatus Acidiferrales bacterium]